eukprot:SAG31_NODE_2553_length_5503_cov_24.613064_2_plen_84_part_00
MWRARACASMGLRARTAISKQDRLHAALLRTDAADSTTAIMQQQQAAMVGESHTNLRTLWLQTRYMKEWSRSVLDNLSLNSLR